VVNKRLNAAVLEIVKNQIRDETPPETKRTYQRLLDERYSEKEVLNLLGCAVISEIYDVLQEGKPYDQQRFIAALKRLPILPWE
jgi:uncharacterized protein with ATP-grasp and redox domains